jgi:polysaccharide pyruvyl transferase CsaB
MKALICGYYGKGNAGDEAILTALLQMLPNEIEPIILSNDPLETKNRYQVQAVDSRSFREILSALRHVDLFIWGGGSLLQDVSSLASPLYYLGLMALSTQMGLITIAWAQGIGPLNHFLTKLVTKQVLKKVKRISVRDIGSLDLLKSWNLDAVLALDPVWALQSNFVQNFSNLQGPKVAINLRPHEDLSLQRISQLATGLNLFAKATHTSLLLVPFQVSQDLPIAHRLSDLIEVPHEIVQINDPRELKGIFREIDMLIGMRYHSLIMAASEGSRAFALSYDPKVDRLMEQVGIPGWKINEIPSSPEEISDALLNHYREQSSLSSAQIKSFYNSALLHKELFLNFND